MESGFSAQLKYAIETLSSPGGAFALLAGLIMVLSLFFSPKVKWWTMTGLFWISTFSFFLLSNKRAVHFSFPLETIRANGRTIAAGMLFALLIPAFLSPRGWRLSVVAAPLLAYFFFELMLATRMLIAGVVDRGVLSFIIYPAIFLALGWGLGKWVQTWDDAHRVLKAFFYGVVLFVIGSLYQLAINRSSVLAGGRFMGTSGNPQGAAMNLALALPIALYFVARPAENKVFRIVAAFTSSMLSIFLLWTGSRTGIVMAAVAVGLTFRARIGRFIGVALFTGIFAMLSWQIYEESTTTVSDMFARGDTRTRVWQSLWNQFLEYPVMGGMQSEFGTGENSYLSTAASCGLFGFIPLMLFVAVSIWYMGKSLFIRKFLGPERALVDVCIGVIVGNLLSGMFEAHLLGTLTLNVFIIYVMFVLLAFANDAARIEQYQQQAQTLDQYGEDDSLAPALQPYPAGEFA